MQQHLFVLAFAALFSMHEAKSGKGMAWSLINHDSTLNVDKVGCVGCDAYNGETACSKSLPILCVGVGSFNRPPYNPTGCTTCALNSAAYDGWTSGVLMLSDPIVGTSLLSAAKMTSICQAKFGASFVAAEFHMGKYVVGMNNNAYYYNTWPAGALATGGWGFRGYGNINAAGNFWVSISDQQANCWNP